MKPRALGVVFADQVQLGDVIFASYHCPRSEQFGRGAEKPRQAPTGPSDGPLVCAWVEVREIKHHTDTTVTFFASIVDIEDQDVRRWVEYPLDAPIVWGVGESEPP